MVVSGMECLPVGVFLQRSLHHFKRFCQEVVKRRLSVDLALPADILTFTPVCRREAMEAAPPKGDLCVCVGAWVGRCG